jgi:chromate transport protein ChrA
MSQGAVIGISAGVATSFIVILTLIWYFAYYKKAAAAQ